MAIYLDYYVYAYIRKSNGTPYYIGKGRSRRAFICHKNVTTPKDKTKIVFLESNLTEVGALALERRYIRWYGRKDLGTGILHNRTEGGEGTSGKILTETHKAIISQTHKNKIVKKSTREKLRIATSSRLPEQNGMYGRRHTDKVKQEHSARMKGNKHNVGKKWIYNPVTLTTTSIHHTELLPEGWKYGMLPRRLKSHSDPTSPLCA